METVQLPDLTKQVQIQVFLVQLQSLLLLYYVILKSEKLTQIHQLDYGPKKFISMCSQGLHCNKTDQWSHGLY